MIDLALNLDLRPYADEVGAPDESELSALLSIASGVCRTCMGEGVVRCNYGEWDTEVCGDCAGKGKTR